MIWAVVAVSLVLACTDSVDAGGHDGSHPDDGAGQPARDTVSPVRAALMIYDYHPEQALRVIDSAVTVGSISAVWADMYRAQIYSETRMGDLVDSLLRGPAGVHFDSARAIGERLLRCDTVRQNPSLRQDVLEILVYTARLQEDSVRWRERSQQLVETCREQGAETEALRTEAELAASLFYAGMHERSMAWLDSVTTALVGRDPFRFNELDAYIIAAKRKIGVLNSMGRYVETIPLSRRIIELLDDYAEHPDLYQDGTYREPPADRRDDYIRFYRTQAQNFITAAYAVLGNRSSMEETFYELERTVGDAVAREHLARYHALELEMEAQRRRADAERSMLFARGTSVVALLALCFALYYGWQKRVISRKNHHLAAEIAEALRYKELYRQEQQQRSSNSSQPAAIDLGTLSGEQLFQYINCVIVEEQLFLDPKFGRQTLIDRFQLSKDRASSIFSHGSSHDSLTDYVQELRLDYAARLLTGQPDLPVTQVATQSGFASAQYFSRRFRLHFGMSPTDFRSKVHEGGRE